MPIAVVLSILALALTCLQSFVAPAPASAQLVTVVRHGGLCPSRACGATYRITAKSLTGSERQRLRRAVAALDWKQIRAHPFKGTCPLALDGQETIYRFRGFPHELASCRYDLRTVRAVRLTERLLRSS